MLGLRERKLVGVDGMEEADDAGSPGNGSLNLVANITGDECADAGLLPLTLEVLLCSDDVDGRRPVRDKEICGNEEDIGVNAG